jgi:lipoprotein NlpD
MNVHQDQPVRNPRQALPPRRWRALCSCAALAFVAACASHPPAPVVERAAAPVASAAAPGAPAAKDLYTVKKGDTLYSIALDNGLDYRELAGWNGIDNPNRILVGQQLRVKSSAADNEVAVAKPIVAAGALEKRTLDGNSETFKREPKGGKEPYSDQALAAAQASAQAKPVEAVAAAPAVAAKSDAKADAKTDAKTDAKPADARPAEAAAADEIVWQWPAGGKTIATFNEGTNKGVDVAGKSGDAVLAAGDGKVVYSGSGLRGYGKLVIIKHNATYLSAYAHNRSVLVKEGQAVTKGQRIAEMGDSDAEQVKLHFEIRRQGKPVDPLKYLPPR